ncbi:hypothetical protein G9P44_002988 [Scheffersomyces stipitis]|nr:hypothetical protein G9P44_002988 [Scheffersomyces stipitis]
MKSRKSSASAKRQSSLFEFTRPRRTESIDLTQDENTSVNTNVAPSNRANFGTAGDSVIESNMHMNLDTKIETKIGSNIDPTESDSGSIIETSVSSFTSTVKVSSSEKYETLSFGDFIEDTVKCPICNYNITYYAIDDRTRHVDLCLQRLSLESNPSKPQESLPKRRKKAEPAILKEKLRYVNDITSGDVSSNVEVERKPATESIEILDATVATPKAKQIKPPTKIINSKQRNPIPTLKTLSFPVDSCSSYEVSVDAFCYAPHATIDQYFLTHFHSDHYGGISKKWSYERVFKEDTDFDNDSKYRRIIYCTKITGVLLTRCFSVDPRFIKHLEMDTRYIIKSFVDMTQGTSYLQDGGFPSQKCDPGLYVTPITANHCPGSAIFLFESYGVDGSYRTILHCGDFRVNESILKHPLLYRFNIENENSIPLDKVYLDTTYMAPEYNFPKQELVCETIGELFYDLIYQENVDETLSSNSLFSNWFGVFTQSRITDFWKTGSSQSMSKKKKFLILVGTYLIGKERLAIAISKRLNCPIYVSTISSRRDKIEIVRSYEDEYLNSVLIEDDLALQSKAECVVHLVPMKIVSSATELSNYFNYNKYYEHFERCVGLRPTGWSFVPGSRGIDASVADEELEGELTIDNINPDSNHLSQLLSLMTLKPQYSYMRDILPQAPLPRAVRKQKAAPDKSLYRIYSLPYSEHSSFRELAYFSIFFNIKQIIPTVNVHNSESIRLMKGIIDTWEQARELKLNGNAGVKDAGIEDNLVKLFGKLSLEQF